MVGTVEYLPLLVQYSSDSRQPERMLLVLKKILVVEKILLLENSFWKKVFLFPFLGLIEFLFLEVRKWILFSDILLLILVLENQFLDFFDRNLLEHFFLVLVLFSHIQCFFLQSILVES